MALHLSASQRIQSFLDPGTFIEQDDDLQSCDPLDFRDVKKYSKRVDDAKAKTGLSDSVVCGQGKLFNQDVSLAVFDFRFMGGSMGSVAGEKVSRTFQRALDQKNPAIIFSSSGGARMQEGLYSLMQMAKTCSSLASLKEAGVPMISIMTNPTTGGVAASFSMLGDINIAEPGALIGFAGARVIKQTIGENLPKGFQTAEYLLEHGMLDIISPRSFLRQKVGKIIQILNNQKRKNLDV